MKFKAFKSFVILVMACLLILTGCSKEAKPATSEQIQNAVQDADAFIEKIRSMPPGERKSYVKDHQEDMAVLLKSPRPEHMQEFGELMSAAQ